MKTVNLKQYYKKTYLKDEISLFIEQTSKETK